MPTIDYADPQHTRSPLAIWLGRWWWRLAIVVGLVVALFASMVLPLRHSELWCDPVSGTTKRQISWLGISLKARYEISPLEIKLRAIGYVWPQTWQFMSGSRGTIWGRASEWEDGSAPVIYFTHSSLEGYAKTATADELRQFADTMRFGTEDQQNAAAKSAGEIGIDAMMRDGTRR